MTADEISVADIQGKSLATGKGAELELTDFSEGIHILKIRKGKEIFTGKIYLKH